MGLVLETDKFWVFEGWFGQLIEVDKTKYSTWNTALARAREKAGYKV